MTKHKMQEMKERVKEDNKITHTGILHQTRVNQTNLFHTSAFNQKKKGKRPKEIHLKEEKKRSNNSSLSLELPVTYLEYFPCAFGENVRFSEFLKRERSG